jgi:hypothetical protein
MGEVVEELSICFSHWLYVLILNCFDFVVAASVGGRQWLVLDYGWLAIGWVISHFYLIV